MAHFHHRIHSGTGSVHRLGTVRDEGLVGDQAGGPVEPLAAHPGGGAVLGILRLPEEGGGARSAPESQADGDRG